MADFSNFSELVAKYNLTLPTLSDGQATNLQVDENGRLLVQSDVSVSLDHANDSVKVGDGTNFLAVNANGSIDVNILNTSIAVTASDLDIRDLSHSSDSIQIGDGSDFLAINADGSINVSLTGGGVESDASSDSGPSGDGLVALTAGPDVLVSIPHTSGTYKIYGIDWASDKQCAFKLEVRDSGVLVETIRASLNSGSNPSGFFHFNKPIEISGAANRVIQITATRINGSGGFAAGGINGELA